MEEPIRCANCGAEYESLLRQCPYCGAANETQLEREHVRALEEIERRRRELPGLPGQLVRLWGKRWARLSLAAAAVLLAGGILWAGFGGLTEYISNRTAPKRQEQHLANLRELVRQERYGEIWDYLQEQELFGGAYGEYTDLYFASYALYYADECRELLAQGEIRRSVFGRTLREAAEGIREIDGKLAERVYTPETEAAMNRIRERLMELLTQELGFEDAEVQALLRLSRETEELSEDEELLERFAALGQEAAARQGIRIAEDGEEWK